ncbi:MAG: hypothetical protein AAF723_00425, partial [Pseudomonadota bacterium]
MGFPAIRFLNFGSKKKDPIPKVDVSRVLRSSAAPIPDQGELSQGRDGASPFPSPLNEEGKLVLPQAASTGAGAKPVVKEAALSEAAPNFEMLSALSDKLEADEGEAPTPPKPETKKAGVDHPSSSFSDQDIDAKPASSPKMSWVEKLTPLILWASLALVVGSMVYGVSRGGVDIWVATILAAGVLLFFTLFILAAVTKAYSPLLFANVILKRRATRKKGEAAVLAGGDVLSVLGLAESILDADADARLVTTQDGVVVYANDSYMKIATEAGVVGTTGLPPRIDRLFGQAGTESSKMFRLARAARSCAPADEVITQAMGHAVVAEQIPRRRFEVSVRPMRDGDQYVAWRLREVPIESARDSLRTSYADYPRPVFAVERSGNLAWMNIAAADTVGVRPGATLSLNDFVLGETKEIVSSLWDDQPEEVEGRIRTRDGESNNLSVVFTPFGKGGVGEGFVCVEMLPKGGVLTEKGAADLASDVTEAPFGVAVVEGDPGTAAKL